jgi:putative hemolysin
MARWFVDCKPLCGHPWRLGLATETHERDAAYRLRHDVFFREMGYGNGLAPDGRDVDSFDEWCDHIILQDVETSQLIGTYRAIPGSEAIRRGGFYGEHEFDISPLGPIAAEILQGSRTCVHADYRTGLAFNYLSYGIELVFRERGCKYFLGAESFHVEDANSLNTIYSYVLRHGMDPRWRVAPTPSSRIADLREVPVTKADERRLPTIIRSELRMGFKAISPPAWDPDFRSYDILFLGERARLSPLYDAYMNRVERQLTGQTSIR